MPMPFTDVPNILIVDDTEANLRLIESSIRKIRINPILALSGSEALTKTHGIDLALAIVDVRMPVMSGYEFALKLNEERPDNKVPIIFLTANFFDKSEMLKGYRSGAVDYIFKPVDNLILLSKINVFLDLFNQKQTILRNASLLSESALELTRVNTAIKTSEAKFRSTFDQSPVGSAMVSLEKCFIRYNAALCDFLGYSETELIGKVVSDITYPGDIEHGIKELKQLEEGEIDSFTEQKRFLRKDGKVVWGEVSISLVFDENNKPLYFLPIIQDITERKQAEKALIESRELYRDSIELAVDGIMLISNDGLIIDANSCINTMTGRNREELIGRHISNSIFLQDTINVAPFEFGRLENGEIVVNERNILRPDGSEITVETRTKMMPNNWYQSIFRDITIRKWAEAELKQQNEILEERVLERTAELVKSNTAIQQTRQNYETFFNTIDEFLFVLDEQLNIILTNTTVIHRLGYQAGELFGKSVLFIYPPERRIEAHTIIGEMLSGVQTSCPLPIVTKSGAQISVDTKVSHGFWDGKPVIFGVTKDISLLKLSEEKFSKVFHINPSACGLSDLTDNKYMEVNEAFYKLLGFNKDEVIGKTVVDLDILSTKTRNAILLKADSNGNVKNEEADLKAKNGEIKHVMLSSENINLQDKEYRFTVVHDITEKKQNENNIFKAIIQTEEKERAHFSKELHDGLGPLLSTIKLYLQWSGRPQSSKYKENAILKAGEILEDALVAVKEISNKLSPHLLTNYGLTSAVQSFIDKLEATSTIRIAFQSNISRRFENEIEVAIYRAIIECINNTIKHAMAGNIYIMLYDSGTHLKVQYSDDGIGFDVTETLSLHKGLGLFNLQNRIQTIGGKITMFSKPGQGVEYKISLRMK